MTHEDPGSLLSAGDLWLQKAGQVSTSKPTWSVRCAVTHAEPLAPRHSHAFFNPMSSSAPKVRRKPK